MNKKNFLEWLVMILIILFFAIPLCSLALNESVTHWPAHPTQFLYNFLLK
jgi:hypothetical protein